MSESPIKLRVAEFDRLAALRGWVTAKQKSEALGISPAQLAKVRAGQSNAGAKFIAATLDAFDVPYGVLFERVTKPAEVA